MFVDESGDLGFGKLASRYVTLSAVSTEDPIYLARIPKKIRKRRLKKSLRSKPELKYYTSSPEIRRVVLEMVAALGSVSIGSITVEKSRLARQSRERRNNFCHQLCGELACQMARHTAAVRSLNVVFDDRPFNMSVGHGFDVYVTERIRASYDTLGLIQPRVIVSRVDSLNSQGLQVADFVAGAIQRRYEFGDAEYSSIITDKIVFERMYQVK